MSGGASYGFHDEAIQAYNDTMARRKEDEFTRLQMIEFNYKIDTSYLKNELRKCNEKLILNTSSTEQQQQQQQQQQLTIQNMFIIEHNRIMDKYKLNYMDVRTTTRLF
jgi:hypothetical protein